MSAGKSAAQPNDQASAIDRLKTQNMILQQKVNGMATLENNLAAMKKKNQEMEDELHKLQEEFSSVQSELTQIKSENRDHLDTNEELTRQIENLNR